MDSFERVLLKFVLAWAPYGGPREDDVWIEFGMTAEQLRVRFARTVAGQVPRARALSAADRSLLGQACRYLRHQRESGERCP